MNIAIDITPLKQKNLSGVGKYLKETLSRLLILDRKNKYFLISFGRKNKSIDVDLKSENVKLIHYNIPSKLMFILSLFFKWPNLDVDIFWLPNFNICHLKGRSAGRQGKNIKLISTVHDLSFIKYPQFLNWSRKLWHKFVCPRKIIQNSDKLIAVSENTSLDLQNIYHVSTDKIIVSPLGVDRKFNKIAKQEYLQQIKEKYQLKNDFVLFVGTKEPRKNILAVLMAFKKINFDLDLFILGPSGWKEGPWRDYYQHLPPEVKERIKILDYCLEKDLPALYNLAKVFIWPSFYEGFGLPVLEALACGCPVISSNNSSLPEVVKENALLIEAFDVQDLYLALKQLLTDQDLYNFYKSKSFDKEYYNNWDRAAEELLELFNKLKIQS